MPVVDGLLQSYADRVDVVGEHHRFFADLTDAELATAVPACPGWTVNDVVRHVGAFAYACCCWYDTDDLGGVDPLAFNLARRDDVRDESLQRLGAELSRLHQCLVDRGPSDAVWGYLGMDDSDWLALHCACEWGLHRHDVEVALGRSPSLVADRASDALRWTTGFVFPLNWHFARVDPFPTIRLRSPSQGIDYLCGDGAPAAELSGDAHDLLLHLWRRPHGAVVIQGDPTAARHYTGLVVGRD